MKLNAKRTIRLIFRLLLILVISIFAVIVVLIVFAYFDGNRLERHFRQITAGMTEEQVLSVMGKPDSIGNCGELGRLPVPRNCYREYLYHPLLTISTLAVFFDAKGRVVGRYDYESP